MGAEGRLLIIHSTMRTAVCEKMKMLTVVRIEFFAARALRLKIILEWMGGCSVRARELKKAIFLSPSGGAVVCCASE
jgi:hypothetical protein